MCGVTVFVDTCWFGAADRAHAGELWFFNQRVVGFKVAKSAKVPIRCQQFFNAMRQAQRGYAGIMDQRACCFGRVDDPL